ncbi:MAG: outer membrane protein assembly factor BamB [Rhodoferax sp.]
MQAFTKRFAALLATAVVVAGLTACSGTKRPKPADLGPNPAAIGVRTAWTASIGSVTFPLSARVVDNLVYLASSDGVVVAIDARTGGDLWRSNLGVKLNAGVGSDGRYAAVVSRDGELINLDGGKEIWRQKLGATSLTAPLVAGSRVFVLAADRAVTAYDAQSGRKLWSQPRTGDALTLGKSGIIMAVGDTLVVGQGGRLVGMQPLTGKVRWDVQVANSRGTNEVERLVDLIAGVSRQGDQVCARAFQSTVGCVDASRGTLLWSKSANGATGLDGDAQMVYGTESDGNVVAWQRKDGERMWVSELLRYRYLTAPTVVGKSVVVGDDTGTVHFLSSDKGNTLNRMSTDGSPIVTTPVLAGQTLVVVTQRGGVFGFKSE